VKLNYATAELLKETASLVPEDYTAAIASCSVEEHILPDGQVCFMDRKGRVSCAGFNVNTEGYSTNEDFVEQNLIVNHDIRKTSCIFSFISCSGTFC
jgi:hypothetical protein